jgi:hypothetical protein
MTSHEIVEVRYEGVICKTDAAITEGRAVQFLSIYGAPQQTKALFSALAASRGICIGEDLYYRTPQAIRCKGLTLGYAKSHAVIYTEDLGTSIILWTSCEEKERRLRHALAKRKIPYDPKDLGQLEKMLRDLQSLIPLHTVVGSIAGYRCEFNDNEICDRLVETLYRNRPHKAAA